MSQVDTSLSFANPHPYQLNTGQKIGLAFVGIAVTLLIISLFGGAAKNPALFLWGVLGSFTIGGLVYAYASYHHTLPGIKNHQAFFRGESGRGALGWILGVVVTAFYVFLYWYPQYIEGMYKIFDPLSMALSGNPASQWFMYGTFYTLAIIVLGIKFIYKYRHNRYQQIRTVSVMFFQTAFAFLIPEFLARLNSKLPYNDFKNMWPLNYYFFDDYRIDAMVDHSATGNLGLFMLIFGVAMVFIISPILTYFYGKRWYCSWVCGCGGLAETAGDPFRQLSDKSLRAWRIERWLINIVLVLSVIMTVAVIYSYYQNRGNGFWVTKEMFLGLIFILMGGLTALLWLKPEAFGTISKNIKIMASAIMGLIALLSLVGIFTAPSNIFYVQSYPLRSWYGFWIGAAFSGVIGVGFYPIMGSRVWCRFGCPMAGILGLQQRFFSRFRITTNGGQCISCGNCSTYCEMGIDVRWYAQRGQNIVRSSCVGCGICSAVCPRGVLSLENGPNTDQSRMDEVKY